jgi:hypothetical protein
MGEERLLVETNDVSLNWKKIGRILPRARTPTLQEIQEFIYAADVSGKASTLFLISRCIREGVIEHFKIRDYSRIERDGNLVTGRFIALIL